MKIVNCFVLTCLTTFIFFSCSKDETNNSIVPSRDSTTLIKLIDFDTTKISGDDTLRVYQYSYDDQRRLSNTKLISYSSSGMPNRNFYTTHYYNGNDSLPFKETETRSQAGFPDIIFTRYNNYVGGKLMHDSMISNIQPTIVRNYTYEPGKIVVHSVTYDSPVYSEVRNIYTTKVNGNTIIQRDTFAGIANNFLFSYDNKPNPFAGKPQSPFIERAAPYYIPAMYPDEMPYERNNVTEVNQTTFYNFHYKYFYEYNSDGYPVIARALLQNSNQHFKRFFFYTRM